MQNANPEMYDIIENSGCPDLYPDEPDDTPRTLFDAYVLQGKPMFGSPEESDTPIFDYQRQCIKLTREIDSLRSSYVDLQETVKDCVFQQHNKLWKLKPEVAQLVITLTEKSQLDNTDNNNND